MRICSLEHEPFENIGLIAQWIHERGHYHAAVHLYKNEALPSLDEFDAFIIMGGSMGAYDDALYPWMSGEKEFLSKTVQQNKGLLGICLGAQLLSVVLGGTVTANKNKEIGWFDVFPTQTPSQFLPQKAITVFQWHGDTFTPPPRTIHTFTSPVCQNQAFESEDGKIVGLQFHIETGEENIRHLIKGAPQDLASPGPYIQSIDTMLSTMPDMPRQYALLSGFLDQWALAVGKSPL